MQINVSLDHYTSFNVFLITVIKKSLVMEENWYIFGTYYFVDVHWLWVSRGFSQKAFAAFAAVCPVTVRLKLLFRLSKPTFVTAFQRYWFTLHRGIVLLQCIRNLWKHLFLGKLLTNPKQLRKWFDGRDNWTFIYASKFT